MNRCFVGWPLLCLLFVLIFGCGASEKNDYLILFGEPVVLLDETIYNNGAPIGKVTETQIGPGNRSEVSVKLDSKFKSLLAQNHVFILKAGQLSLTRIAPFGEPLEKNAALLGFASKTEFNLFRIRNLFSDKVRAARSRIAKLTQM